MITPTIWIQRQQLIRADIHGQPVLGLPTREKIAPVKLEFGEAHTTVRTDSSATVGHATEPTATVVILALPTSKIAVGDILTILSNRVKVFEVHQRYMVTGKLDHIQVGCISWTQV